MYFPTTHWTVLAQATLADETQGRSALDDLCRRYWLPLHQFIRMRGYTETEAQEVVQETIIAVSRQMPEFRYDPKIGSFKSWLRNTTSWRIHDQFRLRPPIQRESVEASGEVVRQGQWLVWKIDPASLKFVRR